VSPPILQRTFCVSQCFSCVIALIYVTTPALGVLVESFQLHFFSCVWGWPCCAVL